jgi:hypothetical protein
MKEEEKTVMSCCSQISRLEAEINVEEEIAELERKQEEREIQRKKKLIELKLNKAKTRAIDGQGSRQTFRRTSVNRHDWSVGFDWPKIDEWLSKCAEDNQQIPNNIASHREEDI